MASSTNGSGESLTSSGIRTTARRDGDRYLGDICDLNFTTASQEEKDNAAWDLQWEDHLDPEDEYTIPDAIVLAARVRGWL